MGDSTPICRCRVLYLGSAVPRQSKDGLQGIQEPLRSLYPSEGAIGAKGIDSWLSVWSNGILLENVDEHRKQVTRFFPIESLHYCAAVRQVLIPERGNSNPEPKFLPLDSPFARTPKAQHPPIFAAILRRTTGIKVLECHVFICKREAAANALVRCCFHAYADNSYARQLEGGSSGSVYGTLTKSRENGVGGGGGGMSVVGDSSWRSRAGSTTTLSSIGRPLMNGGGGGGGGVGGHSHMGVRGGGGGSTASGINGIGDAYTVKNLYASSADLDVVDDGEGSIYNNGDANHKVWSGSQDRLDAITIGGGGGGGVEGPYDMYSGGASTLGRMPRARQISVPIPVAPPPKDEKKFRKEQKKLAKSMGSQSLSGTLIRPKPVHGSTLMRAGPPPLPHPHHQHHQQHLQQVHHPQHGTMMYGPVGHHPRQFHTFSHRNFVNNGYTNGMMGGGSVGGGGGGGGGGGPGSVYGGMSNGTQVIQMPMHPHMQMPVMMPQQYATLQNPRNLKKKKKDKMMMNGGGGMIPIGMPVVPPMYAAYSQQSLIPTSGDTLNRPLAMSNRKLAQSAAAGLDDSGNSGAESPGGTGIYRRKGHLNERAFSYSIRQEHRSRSHGSLASLQFNPPDVKKEREIAQMVAGLDLNDGSSLHRHRQLNGNGNGNINNNNNNNMNTHNNNNNNNINHNQHMSVPASGTYGKQRR